MKGHLLSVLILFASCSSADFDSSRVWFSELPESDRGRLQLSLVFNGHYNAFIDGEFGRGTFNAITAFQKSLGQTESGVLSSGQITRLEETAGEVMKSIGFEMVEDPVSELKIAIPTALVSDPLKTKRGSRWSSADRSIDIETILMPSADTDYFALYDRMRADRPGRRVVYAVIKEGFFVVSGTEGDRRFYLRFFRMPEDTRGFSLGWNPEQIPLGDRIAVAMASLVSLAGDDADEELEEEDGVPETSGGSEESASSAPTPADSSVAADDAGETTSTGTGFIVGRDGYVATNVHVIEGCSDLEVAAHGPARLIRADSVNDIAIIKFSPTDPLNVAALRRRPLELGESVYVLGYPLSPILGDALTISSGIVAALSGIGGDMRHFQISASVQPGNSGGPVVDEYGAVAGIVVSRLNDVEVLMGTGSIPQNVNFAIRGSLLEPMLQSVGVEVEPDTGTASLTASGVANAAKRFTVQVRCR